MFAIGKIGGSNVPPRRPVNKPVESHFSASFCADCRALLDKLPNTFLCNQCHLPLQTHGVICNKNAVAATSGRQTPQAGRLSTVGISTPTAGAKVSPGTHNISAVQTTKGESQTLRTRKQDPDVLPQQRQHATWPFNPGAAVPSPANYSQPSISNSTWQESDGDPLPDVHQPKSVSLANREVSTSPNTREFRSEKPDTVPLPPTSNFMPLPLHPDTKKRVSTSQNVASPAISKPSAAVPVPFGRPAYSMIGTDAKLNVTLTNVSNYSPRPPQGTTGGKNVSAPPMATPKPALGSHKPRNPARIPAGNASSRDLGVASTASHARNVILKPQRTAIGGANSQVRQGERLNNIGAEGIASTQHPRPQSDQIRPVRTQVLKPANQVSAFNQQTSRPHMPHLYQSYTADSNTPKPALPIRPPIPPSKSTSAIHQIRQNKWIRAGGKMALNIGVRTLVGDLMNSSLDGGDYSTADADEVNVDAGNTDVSGYPDDTAQNYSSFSDPDPSPDQDSDLYPTIPEYSANNYEGLSNQDQTTLDNFQSGTGEGTSLESQQNFSDNQMTTYFDQEYSGLDYTTTGASLQDSPAFFDSSNLSNQNPTALSQGNIQPLSSDNSVDSNLDTTAINDNLASDQSYNDYELSGDECYPYADISESWDPSGGAFGISDASNSAFIEGDEDPNSENFDQSANSPGSGNPWLTGGEPPNSEIPTDNASIPQWCDTYGSSYDPMGDPMGTDLDSGDGTAEIDDQLADYGSDNLSSGAYGESSPTMGTNNFLDGGDEGFDQMSDNNDMMAGYGSDVDTTSGLNDNGTTSFDSYDISNDGEGEGISDGDYNTDATAFNTSATGYADMSDATIGIDQAAMEDDNAEMQGSQTFATSETSDTSPDAGQAAISDMNTDLQENEEMITAEADNSTLLAASSMPVQ